MKEMYDVAIIGGGVIGASIAYQLVKRGMKVVLLEKGRVVSQASSAAAGMLAAQAEFEEETGSLFQLAVQSRELFPQISSELKEASGIDIGLVQQGMLKVALTEGEAQQLQNIIRIQQAAGQSAEWLSASEVKEKEPNLSQHVLGAMYIPGDGQVIAPELSLGFVKSAATLGAVIKEFSEVKSLLIEDGRVKGVVTREETIYAGKVVLAAGAWSDELLQEIGINLAVYPVKGECFSVLTHQSLVTSTIFSHGCYLVPKRGGRLVVGATMVEHTYDKRVSVEGMSLLLERAKRLLPTISQAEWEKGWAGTRPQTKDGLPYLGEHPDYPGVFVAAGHYRNGILLSPITGVLIADLIEGNSSTIDLQPFRIMR
ncbi:glycine oxidase ThiO [Ammoniphilus resinae]|uniref:glycine oxidase n=1 Tax=Ammoniphilus resinae TaxID=861532 RepID=A0ABS4GR59_9BACL|nr:glycine oxidase ThiO [Ammoniphilus resinae]MBP1932736.1 glycine oxidase [Ammoniphilus resinae]